MENENHNFIHFIGADMANIGIRCHGELNQMTNKARLVLDEYDKDAKKAYKFVKSVLKCEDRTQDALCNHFRNSQPVRTS